MEREQPFLRIEGLTKKYRQGGSQVLAVNSFDLEIQKGEIFGLVGESGCGKSTLGQMLVRLVEPTSGRVLLDGEDVTRPKKRRRKELCRRMQIVFQDPYASIDTGKTVGWLLEEPLLIHGIGTKEEREEKVLRMLKAVGLDKSCRKSFPGELSGGQRQRVAIALALILEPEFVVCDEPVSALDVSVQAQVLDLLSELRASLGLTYLFISHDLNVVSYLSDRVGVMYLGNLMELGTSEEVARRPLHPYTRALFAASPGMDAGEKLLLAGDPPSPSEPPPGCPFHTRCPYAVGRCKTEKPALRSFGEGRLCACHRMEELDLSRSAGSGSQRRDGDFRQG